MSKQYSQIRAMMAITRASLRAIFRSPSAVIFSFAFPLIFILVFGFIGGGGRMLVRVAFDKLTYTTSEVYHGIRTLSGLHVISGTEDALKDQLSKGRLNALISI